jgi:hypothetical protein
MQQVGAPLAGANLIRLPDPRSGCRGWQRRSGLPRRYVLS